MVVVSRNVLAAVAGIAILVAAGAGLSLLGPGFEQPQVESVENEFGRVTEERSVVHSRVVVDNPNDRALPASATVRYGVEMNGVRVADGRKRGVRVRPGRNVVRLNASLDNSKIPSWWVTHVNNGERTTVTTAGRVSLSGLPLGTDLPARNQTIETDLLGPFANASAERVVVANRSVLAVSNRRAAWREANGERTPVRFAAELENTHNHPVQIDGTVYEVRMNDVIVGKGTTDDAIVLAPGESGTFTVDAAIDTPRMQRWWVSHLRNNETTRLEVEVYAVAEQDGERRRVPLAVVNQRARFRTDMLGSGNTTVEQLPLARAEEFNRPEVTHTESKWGKVDDESTEIVTDVTVSNPNEGTFGDAIRLRVGRTTTINGVTVTEGAATLDGLDPGNNTLRMTGEMDHDDVPRWWARHLNDGEQSAVETTTSGTVDVGVTVLDVDPPNRSNTVETNLLAGMNDDTPRQVESNGRTVATIERTHAEWGEATPERAPLKVRITITNEEMAPMTVRDVEPRVQLNNITLANDTIERSWTIAPRRTETIEMTVDLNNSRMADWWPTHVHNGERSLLRTEAYATIEVSGRTERIELESLGDESTVETDLLAE